MDLHPGPEKRRAAQVKLSDLEPIRRALQENEDWYQDLVEHSQDLLCIHDLEGRLLLVNPAPARVLGYSVEEILQIPMREMIIPEFRPDFDAYLKDIAISGESHGWMGVVTRSGEQRIWEYHNTLRTEGVASPIVRGMAHDVTEQRRAEQLAREANELLRNNVSENERTIRELKLFRALVDQCNDAIEVVDPATLRFLDVNEKACSALGYSREELLSLGVFDIDPAITESLAARVKEQLQEPGLMVMESVHRRKDGSTFPVEVSMRRVQLERDYVVAIARDLTERKRAEEALQRGEEDYRNFVSRSSEGIFRDDLDAPVRIDLPEDELIHRVLYDTFMAECNDAMAAMYGFDSGKELRGVRMSERVVAEDPRNIELAREFVRSGFRLLEHESHEVDRYGNPKVFLNSMIGTVEDGRLVRIWGIQRDVSEKVKLEESRRKAEEALRQNVAQLQRVTEELRLAKEKLSEEKLYLEEAIDTELGFG
jgi:PAS domain S-box-containing protein